MFNLTRPRLHFLSIIYFLCLLSKVFSQQNIHDSLVDFIEHSANDTNKINAMLKVGRMNAFNNPAMALQWHQKALALSQKIKWEKGEAISQHGVGFSFYLVGDIPSAKKELQRAIGYSRKIKNKTIEATSINDQGLIFYSEGEYEKALRNFFEALRMREALGDNAATAKTLTNIGLVFHKKGDNENSLVYQLRALKLREEVGDKNGIAGSLNNIAMVYEGKKEYNAALEYYLKAVAINEVTGNSNWLAVNYNNIGNIYIAQAKKDSLSQDKAKLQSALKYLLSSYKIRQQIGDSMEFCVPLCNIAIIYYDLKNYDKALEYFQLAVYYGHKTNNRDTLLHAYKEMAAAYAAKGNFSKAYESHKMFSALQDSVMNVENSRQINEMSAKYESEKKDQAYKVKESELKSEQAVSARKALQRNVFIGGFVLAALMGLVIFRSLVLNKRKNKIILAQKAEVERQKEEIQEKKQHIEEKQKEILDSIYYARRIQRALVTNEKNFTSMLKKCRGKFIS